MSTGTESHTLTEFTTDIKIPERGCIRHAQIPDDPIHFTPKLLRHLADNGWTPRDIAHDIVDYDYQSDTDPPQHEIGAATKQLKQLYRSHDIEPSNRATPTDNSAELLWRCDPEEFAHWGDEQ
jgi:hypothetical protein